MPLFALHPLHGRADDLVVALERGQIFLHAPAECRKAVAQPHKTSLQRIVEALLDHIGESVGSSGAHGYEPEHAALAQVDLQRGQAGRIGAMMRQFIAPRSLGTAVVSVKVRTVDLIPSAPTTRS